MQVSGTGEGENEEYIFVEDFDEQFDPVFIHRVLKPYFKDVYNDLKMRCPQGSKGLVKTVLHSYLRLPEVISSHFFSLIDVNDRGYISAEEFSNWMSAVYVSRINEKLEFTFKILDFNKDKLVTAKDVKLLLSFIDVESLAMEADDPNAAGRYTSFQSFTQRVAHQREITQFIKSVFSESQEIDMESFVTFNKEVSSEMFCSVMTCFHHHLPCTGVIVQLKNAFKRPQASDQSSTTSNANASLASPMIMERLAKGLGSPMTPASENVRAQQKKMQRFADRMDQAKKKKAGNMKLDLSKKKGAPGTLQGSGIEKQKAKVLAAAAQRQEEESKEQHQDMEVEEQPKKDPLFDQIEELTVNDTQMRNLEEPRSALLLPSQKPIDFLSNKKNFVHEQTEVYLSTENGGFREYIIKLFGPDIYFYTDSAQLVHDFMHTLVGTFISLDVEKKDDERQRKLYPIKIGMPPRFSRRLYFADRNKQNHWLAAMRKVAMSQDFYEFYDIRGELGKGSMGEIKLAVQKRTGEEYAAKIIKKANRSEKELELQRREIEALKMCQHKNLIKLLDHFEDNKYLFIVLEYMKGGDMYDYLNKRDFSVSEERALELATQMSKAIFYLSSFGIIHRDLKLENIMMTDNTDQAVPKVVDFGLSAIIAPDQKIQGAVGTVAYAPPEIFRGDQYDKSVDVWSLGVIFYALLMGFLPYDSEDKKQIVKMLLNDPVPFDQEWNEVSPFAKHIVVKMLQKDKTKRCTIEEVMCCAWLNGGREIPLESLESSDDTFNLLLRD